MDGEGNCVKKRATLWDLYLNANGKTSNDSIISQNLFFQLQITGQAPSVNQLQGQEEMMITEHHTLHSPVLNLQVPKTTMNGRAANCIALSLVVLSAFDSIKYRYHLVRIQPPASLQISVKELLLLISEQLKIEKPGMYKNGFNLITLNKGKQLQKIHPATDLLDLKKLQTLPPSSSSTSRPPPPPPLLYLLSAPSSSNARLISLFSRDDLDYGSGLPLFPTMLVPEYTRVPELLAPLLGFGSGASGERKFVYGAKLKRVDEDTKSEKMGFAEEKYVVGDQQTCEMIEKIIFKKMWCRTVKRAVDAKVEEEKEKEQVISMQQMFDTFLSSQFQASEPYPGLTVTSKYFSRLPPTLIVNL